MNLQLKKTDTNLFILNLDAEIKEGEMCYNPVWEKEISQFDAFANLGNKAIKIIAQLKPELPNITQFEIKQEVDLERLAEKHPDTIMFHDTPDLRMQAYLSFKVGFTTHKELNKEKEFSKVDILNLINEIGFIKTTSKKLNSKDYQPFITDDDGQVWTINKEHLINYLQSLSTPDIGFGIDYEVCGHNDPLAIPYGGCSIKLKLDGKGCEIEYTVTTCGLCGYACDNYHHHNNWVIEPKLSAGGKIQVTKIVEK